MGCQYLLFSASVAYSRSSLLFLLALGTILAFVRSRGDLVQGLLERCESESSRVLGFCLGSEHVT
jgi:hypothetical protein